MIKAFLFGGPNNGEVIEVAPCREILMPPIPEPVNYADFSEHASILAKCEKYIKHDFVFRKDGWRDMHASGYKQLEDINVYFHSSISKDVIDSIGQVVLLAIQAKWENKVN